MAEGRKIARGRALIMTKLEKPQAISRLDEIIERLDAVMVARGDLGVEMPLEKVPGLQKRITRAARRLGKPVVIATQMLESMITSPVPTRAEVSDVATAVFEGADAVMLSAESASGQYPVEAVRTMNRIAEEVERDPIYWSIITAQRNEPEATGSDAIAAALAPDRRRAEPQGRHGLDLLGLDGAQARPRAPELDRAGPDAEARHGAPPRPRLGRAPDRHQGRERRRRHGVPGGEVRGARGDSPPSATASSSSPACPSGRPAPPTWCASSTSRRSTPRRREAAHFHHDRLRFSCDVRGRSS